MSNKVNGDYPLVKTPVQIQDTYVAYEIALLLNVGINRVYELAKRDIDPLPFRSLPNYARCGFALRSELLDWIGRNAPQKIPIRRRPQAE